MSALLVVLALLGAWEAYVRAGGVDELVLPAPTHVAESLWQDRSLLAEDLLVTASEVALGLLAAIAIGVAVAVAMHLSDRVRRATLPLVIGSQAVPIPVISAPLLFVLGFGLGPKIVVVALICFFPVTINLHDGLRGADPDARKLMRSLGATRWQTLRLLEAPAALPQAFTGLKIAAAVAVIGAVFGEWTGSSEGLGHLVLVSGGQLETARGFAATVVLFALALLLYGLFALLERRAVAWAPRHRPGGP